MSTPYFKETGRIAELVAEVEPKTLSYIITDLRTRRLAGIRQETFEDLVVGPVYVNASIPQIGDLCVRCLSDKGQKTEASG